MTIDIDKLEALARAATAGPWEVRHESDLVRKTYPVVMARNLGVASPWDGRMAEANAAFIAASDPAAVLELLARLRAAEATMRERESPVIPVRDDDLTIASKIELGRLRDIVRDLAACDPRDPEYWKCQLCKAQYEVRYPDDDEPQYSATHAESCPWRRAVEIVKP